MIGYFIDILLQQCPPLFDWSIQDDIIGSDDQSNHSTNLFIKFSPLKYKMSKMNKQQVASLKADL